MIITYEIVSLDKVVDFIKSNINKHYEDMSEIERCEDLNIDWFTYNYMGENNKAFAVIGKDNDKIIAYSVYSILPDTHNIKHLVAYNSAIYIDDKYRGKIIFTFLRQCDKFLKDKNANKVLYNYKDNKIGLILEKNGCKAESINWAKTL